MTSASSPNLPYPTTFAHDVFQEFKQKYARATDIALSISHTGYLGILGFIRMNDPRWRLFKNMVKMIHCIIEEDMFLRYENNETLVKYFPTIFTAENIAECPSSRAKGLTISDHCANILEQRS